MNISEEYMVLEGEQDGAGCFVGIVVSKSNESATEKLLASVLDSLTQKGVEKEGIFITLAPNNGDIPMVAKTLANSDILDSVICLFVKENEQAASRMSDLLGQISLESCTPVVCAGIEKSSKPETEGKEAANRALELMNLLGRVQDECYEDLEMDDLEDFDWNEEDEDEDSCCDEDHEESESRR